MLKRFAACFSVCSLAVLCCAAFGIAQDVAIDSDTFSGFRRGPIGPAAMGGRIADIAAVQEGQRLTIYVGSASGGVWKSSDGGTTFKPVFDKQPSLSIGSIAIDPFELRRPSGLAPANRGCATAFRSAPAFTARAMVATTGKTWASPTPSTSAASSCIPKTATRLRLRPRTSLEFQRRSAVSSRPPTAARPGRKFSIATTSTGCAEMAMDPQDPNVLYAAMWDVRREPYNFRLRRPGQRIVQEHRWRRHLA